MSISGLSRGIFELNYTTSGGLSLTNYENVIKTLQRVDGNQQSLQSPYQEKVLQPFMKFLRALSAETFDRVISLSGSDQAASQEKLEQQKQASLIENYVGVFFQRILPSYGGYEPAHFSDLLAFQTVVSTVYNYAIEQFKTRGVVCHNFLAPLAKWDYSAKRVCTMTLQKVHAIQGNLIDTEELRTCKMGAGVVVLPVNYRMGGLFAWAVLGHEVGGHSVLDAVPKIVPELSDTIKNIQFCLSTSTDNKDEIFWVNSDYWTNHGRIEELTSDILGILISGPAIGIGLVGFLKGAEKKENCGKLGLSGSFSIEHPPDVLRTFAMAETIELLDIKTSGIDLIIKSIREEVDASIGDKTTIVFSGHPQKDLEVSVKYAQFVVKVVVKKILTTNLTSLANQSLMDLIKWNENDESIVSFIQEMMLGQESHSLRNFPDLHAQGRLARYIIPAAIKASTLDDSDLLAIFERMKHYLREISKTMIPQGHD